MGELISLFERRQSAEAEGLPRAAPRAARVTFSFDLATAGTYLAAERVDRIFGGVRWQPASQEALQMGQALSDPAARRRAMAEAEERAAALSVPLVWPDPYPGDVRSAMRVAALACSIGRGAAFVLAAGRLAFCGGFDLAEPDVLAEAAAAADIPLEHCLTAAGDVSYDGAIESAGRRLLAMGADRLPALRVGRVLFCGEDRLAEAAAAVQAAHARSLPRPAAG